MTAFSPKRLREAREKRGWTQAELARRLVVSETNVGRWERGKNAPHASTVPQIAKVLGVSVTYLYADNGSRP